MLIIRDGKEIWDGGRMLNMPLKIGDIVSIRSGGGGGWGYPLERNPKLVLMDYKNGLISTNLAKEKYGVIINERKLSVDWENTKKMREEIKQKDRKNF
jgi:N-methylhydantoinase B